MRHILLAALFVLSSTAVALSLEWRESELPSGGELIVADTGEGGWVACALTFPAGVVLSAEEPNIAQLAVRIFGEARHGERSLRESLAKIGWSLQPQVGQDTALILLSGPAEDLPDLLGPLRQALSAPGDFDERALALAGRALAADRERWRANPEARLRSRMAKQLFAEHPYAVGAGRFDEGKPSSEALAGFLGKQYSPAGVRIVVAGDLDADATLRIWESAFSRLEGPEPLDLRWPKPNYGSGRLEADGPARQNVLLMQLPGFPPQDPRAPILALATGIVQLLCEKDIRDAHLARNVSAWYRFTAAGPGTLEIALRGVAQGEMERAEAVLMAILGRVRAGEFSQFMVISAKDRILERLENHSSLGDGPATKGLGALQAWTAEVARQSMLSHELRDSFGDRILAGNIESISEFSADWLQAEPAVLGFLRKP